MFLTTHFLLLLIISTHGKIYDRCELAKELLDKHKAPKDKIATWVCIAEHESQFNTSSVGRRNMDGSGDHGIFQISDLFWCSPPGNNLGCGLLCDELEDDDIGDDFICAKRIYEEHKDFSGDGFNAWSVYHTHCNSSVESYISGCFNKTEENVSSTTVAATTSTFGKPTTTKPCIQWFCRFQLSPTVTSSSFKPKEEVSTTTVSTTTVTFGKLTTSVVKTKPCVQWFCRFNFTNPLISPPVKPKEDSSTTVATTTTTVPDGISSTSVVKIEPCVQWFCRFLWLPTSTSPPFLGEKGSEIQKKKHVILILFSPGSL